MADEGQRATSGASETSTVAEEDPGLSQEMVTEEGRASRGMSAPQRVCKKEREEHERTHLPYRSWCDICGKARGRRLAHRSKSQRGDKDIGTVPRISIDNFYMNEKDQRDGTNPLLIVMDECTGDKYARQVERKGVGDGGAMDWLVKDISEELNSWRHQGGSESRLVFKTDGEFALTSLRDAVGRFHGGSSFRNCQHVERVKQMDPWSRQCRLWWSL